MILSLFFGEFLLNKFKMAEIGNVASDGCDIDVDEGSDSAFLDL